MQGDIVSQGFELMLYGMGTVVLFLALLVAATTAMSAAVARFFPEAAPVASARAQAPAASPGNDELVAVISAAIQQHRSKHSDSSNR